MSDEQKNESAAAGSSLDDYLEGGSVDPNKDGSEGQSTKNNEPSGDNKNVVPETQYKELEKKLGSQGKELGKFRKLFEDTSPLLEKLNSDPELAKAILEGKIDSQLLSDVLEGKVTQKDAETVSEANKEIKKELGKKEYSQKTPEEIEKLIEAKVSEGFNKAEKKTAQKFTDMEKMQEYQSKISDFIANTPDFAEYADAVEKFVSKTGITNVEIAYDAVKGKALQERYKGEETKHIAEAAKVMAANAGGGGSQTTNKFEEKDVLEELIGSSKNPNSY